MASDPKLKTLFREYEKALDDREAAMFIGAGLSMPAGLPSWQELLRDVASQLELSIEQGTGLVALAQYHVNEQGGVRTALDQLVSDAYGHPTTPTGNHRLIAKLPIETVWTTNYDQQIEDAFREVGKRVDVKFDISHFGHSVRGRDVTIYKMHGDASQPNAAVLTKEDYEYYNSDRGVFTDALKGDLVNKTFLFLGFSFTDPNIDYILSRIRVLMRRSPRQHFCIMRRPLLHSKSGKDQAQFDYDKRRLELRIGDMKRYGIQTILIDDYAEIPRILDDLNRRAHRKNVFVSGSSHDRSAAEGQRLERLADRLGRALIQSKMNIVSGFGAGLGNAVLTGALEEVYRDRSAVVADRVLVRPFPQALPDRTVPPQLYTAYRNEILSQVGYTVFLGGTKYDDTTGQVIPAQGVLEEFEITAQLKKYPIPVGATGGAARLIWEQVAADPGRYLEDVDVGAQLGVLGDTSADDAAIVAAILDVMRCISDK